jgi:hypothetical protein
MQAGPKTAMTNIKVLKGWAMCYGVYEGGFNWQRVVTPEQAQKINSFKLGQKAGHEAK